MRCALPLWLTVCWLAGGALAAPPLTDAQRDVLATHATDFDADLEAGPAIYPLLENAAGWSADDFAGDAGAATPPTPDFAFLLEHPEQVRGAVFLIEGTFIEQVRFPTDERDGRDRLQRSGHPAWGSQLTGWGIKVGEGADDVVMVYFVDPDGRIDPPRNGTQVRVAARFYKVWTVPDRDGRDFDFLTFVGGAREGVGGGASPGGPGWNKVVIMLVLVAAGGFYGMRVFIARKQKAGRAHSQALLDQRRRDRDSAGMDNEEEHADPNLPEDPAEALAYLQEQDRVD